jgi:hypothetical protein
VEARDRGKSMNIRITTIERIVILSFVIYLLLGIIPAYAYHFDDLQTTLSPGYTYRPLYYTRSGNATLFGTFTFLIVPMLSILIPIADIVYLVRVFRARDALKLWNRMLRLAIGTYSLLAFAITSKAVSYFINWLA